MSETGSQVSWDDFSDSRCVSPALSCDFDINDTSWAWADNSITSDSELTSPEPSTNSSIWARFNSGISRFTQDLGKTSSTQSSSIPSIRVSDENLSVTAHRDDMIEGAESDGKSEAGDSGRWSIAESFRKFSLGRSQSVTVKSYSTDITNSSQLANKTVIKSFSSNLLDDSCGSDSVDKEQAASGESPMYGEAAASSAALYSMTSLLNHSQTSPFTPVPTSCEAAESKTADSQGVMGLSLSAGHERLALKPPRPQRSGTMSPRDMPSRPRPTQHRRSQSLHSFTPTSSLQPLTDNSTATTDTLSQSETTQNDTTVQGGSETNNCKTREIFV